VRLLVAGLTGQLGQGLLEAAEGTDAELVPVIRATARRSATDRARSVFGRGPLSERTVEGDVTQPSWGLGDDVLDELASGIDAVLNLAGEVDWTATDRSLFTTNVVGAAGGLECARTLYRRGSRCRAYCLASSVHVAGGLTGRVPEARLGSDGKRTRYEHSKWPAEELVLDGASKHDAPAVVVARIGGLIGNSVTGATARRNSLYLLADEWRRLPGRVMPSFGAGRVDALPRDAAGRLVLRTVAAALADSAPEVVHVCAGEAAPRTDALVALARSMDVTGRLGGAVPLPVPSRALVWASQNAERFVDMSRPRGNALAGLRYLLLDRMFERDRLATAVGTDLPAPSLEQLARLLFELPTPEPRSVGDPAIARLDPCES